jgi:TorA maturation chaperone TorD
MRDDGLTLAIEAAGGVAALARGLDITQPSVSGWKRIPADRVLAVEALTGIGRQQLRPDLFAETGSELTDATAIDDIETERGRQYLLLAALLRRPPDQSLMAAVASLTGDASPLGLARIRLANAANKVGAEAAGEEFFNLFVGVGRGELVPFGSYYQTGFLHERPLARVREDLARLGIERAQGVHEPEDHIATLLEIMAGLVLGEFGTPAAEQQVFFQRHLRPWASRFFADLALAEAATFYRAVGEIGGLWIDIETQAFEMSA